jgi:Kef-type K+ transport system membrane component KefB
MSGPLSMSKLARRALAVTPLCLAIGALAAGMYGVQELASHVVPTTPGTLPGEIGESVRATPLDVGRTTAAFGFLLVGSWLAGRLAKAVELPRITGYLVFGVLTGPSFADIVGLPALIGQTELSRLKLIEGLAVSMIAFVAGSEIKLSFVRAQFATIRRILVSEFVGVTLAVWVALAALVLLAPLPEPIAQQGVLLRLYLASVVAVLAVASAPAVTIALIKELRPDPIFAKLALAGTVLKDLVLVVVFSALLAIGIAAVATPDVAGDHAAGAAAGGEAAHSGSGWQLVLLPFRIGMHLVGSLLLGGVVAAVLWALGRFLAMRIELFMVLVCFGIAVVSVELKADALLVALSAGMILTNIGSTRAMPRLLGAIEGLLLPVYCVFFAVAGAKVHLDAVALVWPAMCLVVVVRLAAKRVAVTRAARKAEVPEPTATWLWTSTLPQAGVTLAMAIQVERVFDGQPWTPILVALLLATVACNELLGPPLMKLGIQRVGTEDGRPA